MFGKGKIDIAIQKSHYAPGDIVSGNVALTLKRPVKARELSISLIGEYKVAGDTRTSEPESNSPYVPHIVRGTSRWTKAAVYPGGRPPPSEASVAKNVRIVGARQQLDGENEYVPRREYHFQIRLSEDTPTGPVKWYLLAKLDIPGGLDISKKVDITIG